MKEEKLPPWFELQGLKNLNMVIGYIEELNGFIQDLKDDIRYVEKKLSEHRTGRVVCEETCFCWVVDQWVAMREMEMEGENEI